MATEDLIRQLEDEGYLVVKPRNPDQELRANWNQIVSVLRMSEDLVSAGARLTFKRPTCFGPKADIVALTRSGVISRIEAVLATAVVQEERETADA